MKLSKKRQIKKFSKKSKKKKLQYAGSGPSSYNRKYTLIYKSLSKIYDVDSQMRNIRAKIETMRKLLNNIVNELNEAIQQKPMKSKKNTVNTKLNSKILELHSILKDAKSVKQTKLLDLLKKKDELLNEKIALAINVENNINFLIDRGMDISKVKESFNELKQNFNSFEKRLYKWKSLILKLFDPNRPKVAIYDKTTKRFMRQSFNHVMEGKISRKLTKSEFLLPLDIFEHFFNIKIIRKPGEDFILVNDRLKAIKCLTSNGLFNYLINRNRKTKSPIPFDIIENLVMCPHKMEMYPIPDGKAMIFADWRLSYNSQKRGSSATKSR